MNFFNKETSDMPPSPGAEILNGHLDHGAKNFLSRGLGTANVLFALGVGILDLLVEIRDLLRAKS